MNFSYVFVIILLLGPNDCQNYNIDFKKNTDEKEKRHFSTCHLKRTLTNGEVVTRDWIIYSPSEKAIFCFICRLLGKHPSNDKYGTCGFKDWKNISRSIKQHEISEAHFANNMAYAKRLKQSSSIIKKSFRNEKLQEMDYWRNVLKRVAAVIKFLGSRGLSFRGHDGKFGSSHNGNFLGILELLAQFDPFLQSHIERYGNKGKGNKLNFPANVSF